MADHTVKGIEGLRAALLALAPDLRKGPARRALVKGAEPVLARAIAETPSLKADIYRGGRMVRRAGALRRALRIRSSKDVNRTGDVGVFVNIKPLSKGAIADFKAATGRRSSENENEVYFWRWVHFATKRNKNPKPFLTIAGEQTLISKSLPAITDYLKSYFERINAKQGKP